MIANKVAVIGAGVMGTGLALNLGLFNYQVVLIDNDQDALVKAKIEIPRDFRMIQMMKPELIKSSSQQLMSNLTFSSDYQHVQDVRIVIENITEDWDKKKALYTEIRDIFHPDSLFAINTSCISISKIAGCFNNPGNIVGTHFMNPVPLKEIVEVISGSQTSENTITGIKSFLSSLKKRSVFVNDYPGFVSNRLSHLFMNEAAFLLQDQVAQAKDIDLIFTHGFSHAMGPLATADLIGIDTVVNSLDILYDSYQDPKYRCCPLLIKMVQTGLLGRKTGQGFFKY